MKTCLFLVDFELDALVHRTYFFWKEGVNLGDGKSTKTSLTCLLINSGSTIFPHTPHKKGSFALKIYSVNMTNSAVTEDLATFTEKILNGEPHFLCNDMY